MNTIKVILLTIIFSFALVSKTETTLLPTHDEKTLNINWNLSIAKLKKNGAILTSAKYNIYEYDNLLLFQFTPDGKLKRISIHYSGESTQFYEKTFEAMLKYYYEHDIFCKVEHYQKIGMMSSMLAWFDVPGNAFTVLEYLITQTNESKTSTVFIHAYNSRYYTKKEIIQEHNQLD